MQARPDVIRFGIPSLDELLGHSGKQRNSTPVHGVALEGRTTTVCILGTGGTGKSELGLHLASRYIADALASSASTPAYQPLVFYVSTDLGYGKASSIWDRFLLYTPNARLSPLDGDGKNPYGDDKQLYIQLADHEVAKLEDLGALAAPPAVTSTPEVSFIDFHRSSCQDEWGTLIRLVRSLGKNESGPKHLLVIDSSEGLNTLVAENASGDESRRSRIKRLLALAEGSCHIAFVLEEPELGGVIQEEAVCDLVVRLREVEVKGYQRRTVAIEKLRGQPYVRGQHPIKLRSGRGSWTEVNAGKGDNPAAPPKGHRPYLQNHDDPEVPRSGGPQTPKEEGQSHEHQSYIQVYRSLHALHRSWTDGGSDPKPKPFESSYAQFGIRQLDELLARRSEDGPGGLSRGGVAALIGEPGTHKIHLWRAFLKEAFWPLREPLKNLFAKDADKSVEEIDYGKIDSLHSTVEDCEAAVLVTTSDVDAWDLAANFAKLLLPQRFATGKKAVAALARLILPKIVCRRLELHDLPAPILLNIVTRAVEPPRNWGKDPPVRLVLEDLRIWREIYFDLQREPFFLPVLFRQMRRMNVTTLVVDGRRGQPESPAGTEVENELQSLADLRLHTWRVPFYGDSRVAIAVIPPLSGDPTAPIGRVLVRELHSEDDGVERAVVNPHFELYKGIEAGRPEPVPLEVCLFSETDQVKSYIDAVNPFLEGLFKPFCATGVVRPVAMNDYKTLRDWCIGQPETQLEHTRLLQVDEFWRPSRKSSLRSQAAYLSADDDPYGLHQQPSGKELAPTRRHESFQSKLGYGFGNDSKDVQIDQSTDRVPFTWDFGFLLCKVDAWTAHRDTRIRVLFDDGRRPKTVGEVWDGLPQARAEADGNWGEGEGGGDGQVETDDEKNTRESKRRPTWREFFGACKAITSVSTTKSPLRYTAFDVCLLSSESFSCFVLEVWMSEILLMVRSMEESKKPKELEEWLKSLAEREWKVRPNARRLFGESDDVQRNIVSHAFLRTWLLLAEVLDLERFASPDQPFEPVSRDADTTAVATRFWYKMACTAQQKDPATVTVATGLPGSFSTRGDWFLGVAHESRSWRLADRALDFLSSRRANFERMQLGIGLPTRGIEDKEEAVVRTFLKGPLGPQGSTSPTMNVSYASVKGLGAGGADGEFHWLWRSAFKDYDRLNAIWQKSLVRLVIAWQDFKREHQKDWVSGFDMYDLLARHGDKPLTESTWWKEHAEELRASIAAEETNSKQLGDCCKQWETQLLLAWSRLQRSITMIGDLFASVVRIRNS